VGKVEVRINQSSNPKAPGMLKSHYAPKKPLFIGDADTFLKENKGKKIGIISLEKLSPSKNLKEAAHKLFSALRDLDESDVDVIIAEKFPEDFLGRAINDRLQRASTLSAP
jgi:L-threonylcarbamoyladenylate synthase